MTSAAVGAERDVRRRTRYVHPGQIAVSVEAVALSTILGSCVAVCLWDWRRAWGGMNHFLLPQQHTRTSASPRYGDTALKMLVNRLSALGSGPADLQAKVFGGASVLPALSEGSRRLGAQNIDLALRLLDELGIPLVATDVGGLTARRLVFQTDDGAAWVRTVARSDDE
jgi:chemotaxis protein CheD